MTTQAVQHQIEMIKQVTAEALKSKESARQLLVDAGIIKDRGKSKGKQKKEKT